MVTARPHGTSRARPRAGLLRLLALTVLLMGLFCAHGTAAQDGALHAGPGAPGVSVTHAVTPAAPAEGPDPGRDPVHPAHECAPLPPHQGAVSEASTAAPHTEPGCVRAGPPDHCGGLAPAAPGPVPPVTSAVLRM